MEARMNNDQTWSKLKTQFEQSGGKSDSLMILALYLMVVWNYEIAFLHIILFLSLIGN